MTRWRVIAVLVLAAFFVSVTVPLVLAEEKEPWGSEDKGTTIEKLLAWPLSFPIRMAEKLGGKGGFQPLDRLVFQNGYSEEEKKDLPWNEKEKELVYTWYWVLAVVTAPLYGIALTVTGLKLVKAGAEGNPRERGEAMDGLQRWLLAVVLVAAMPVLVKGLMWLTSILVYAIGHGFDAVAAGRGIADWGKVDLTQMDFSAGSVLGTAILRVFMAGMWFYLNFLYIVRKTCLTIMLCFTPLAALAWAIQRNTTAIPIWLGELASNAFMPVAHGLVLCTILAICDVKDTQNTWLTLLISLYTLIPAAEAIRNSLMSLIARFGGVSEERTALGAMGAVLGLGGLIGLGRAARATIGGEASFPPVGGGNLPRPPVWGSGGPGPVASTIPPGKGNVVGPPPSPSALGKAPDTVFGGVASAARTTAAKVGRVGTAAAGAVLAGIPGGGMVAESMGATAGALAGAARGGGKLAWEVLKDPGKVKAEVKEGIDSHIEAAREKWGEVKQVGGNVAKGVKWVGHTVKQGASWAGEKASGAVKAVNDSLPRYSGFTFRSVLK